MLNSYTEPPINNAKSISERVLTIKTGIPFSNKQLLKYASRTVVNNTLSRMALTGEITRLTKGIYARPQKSYYGALVLPGSSTVIKFIAKGKKEVLHVHGATACNLLGLSRQVPMGTIYHTTGRSRSIIIRGTKITLRHAKLKKLQLTNTYAGIALTALLYMGKSNVSPEIIHQIYSILSEADFKSLKNCNEMPVWLKIAFDKYKAF